MKSTYALKLQCDSLKGGCVKIFVVNSADIKPGQKPSCPKCGSGTTTILDVVEPKEAK